MSIEPIEPIQAEFGIIGHHMIGIEFKLFSFFNKIKNILESKKAGP
jgi:hypothetical protein